MASPIERASPPTNIAKKIVKPFILLPPEDVLPHFNRHARNASPIAPVYLDRNNRFVRSRICYFNRPDEALRSKRNSLVVIKDMIGRIVAHCFAHAASARRRRGRIGGERVEIASVGIYRRKAVVE